MTEPLAATVRLLLEVRGPTALAELGDLVTAIGHDVDTDELMGAVFDAGGTLVAGPDEDPVAALVLAPPGEVAPADGEPAILDAPLQRTLRRVPGWALLGFAVLLVALVALVLSAVNLGTTLGDTSTYEPPITAPA